MKTSYEISKQPEPTPPADRETVGQWMGSMAACGMVILGMAAIFNKLGNVSPGYEVVGGQKVVGKQKSNGLIIPTRKGSYEIDGSVVINGRRVLITYLGDENNRWRTREINYADNRGHWDQLEEECEFDNDLVYYDNFGNGDRILVRANSSICNDGAIEPSEFADNESTLG